MRKLLLAIMLLCGLGIANAQFMQPIKVSVKCDKSSDTEAVITFSATISDGWHMYSTNVVPDGPTPTTINIEKISGEKLEGALDPSKAPIKKYEDMFDTDVYFFENTATFTQKVKLLGVKYEIEGYLEYGACNDENCIPPTAVDFKFDGEAPMPKAQE